MRPEAGEQLSQATRRLTTAVAAVAMLTTVTAAGAGEIPPAALVAVMISATAVTVAAGWIGGRLPAATVASAAAPLVAVVYAAGVLAEPVIRTVSVGRPLEMILLHGLLSTLPPLAFAGGLRRWSPLCGTASLFAVVFATCLLGSPAVAVFAAVWVVIAAAWLTTLVRDFSGGVAMAAESRTLAWGPVVVVGVLAVVVTAATAGRDSLSMTTGFLASSGGDGESSDQARDGVGDGSALVAATQHAESFGPIEDAPFARSDEPSLYDLFDDMFGEAYDPAEKSDRSISLAPEDVLAGEKEMAEAQSAGREFSTIRKPRQADRGNVGELSSASIFYVAGRVPLHLRVQTLERFDGVTWSEGSPPPGLTPAVKILDVDGEPWLKGRKPLGAYASMFSPPEAHALKPVHYRESRIPAPPHITGVHIDRLDREDFYEWVQADVPRLRRKELGKLVPVHLSSRRLDTELIDAELPYLASGGRHELHALPDHPASDRVRSIAREWAGDTEASWRQVSRVLAKLREHAVLDRSAAVDATSDFPAADFLFKTRRGPEFQFATAGAMLLRSLGYQTRLVTGFYARPEKFDFVGQHTPVDGEDVHVWCEVRLSAGLWATVDPSPGYAVLGPPRSVWYRARAAAAAAGRWLVGMWPVWFALSIAAAVLWHRRADVADLTRTVWWRLRGGDDVDAWRIISRRLDVVQEAPPGWTTARRIERLQVPTEIKQQLAELAGQAEATLFAGTPTDRTQSESFVRRVTLRQLRRWQSDAPASELREAT